MVNSETEMASAATQGAEKNMYVLNLDRQRITIIAGVILMLCGTSFFLGARLGGDERISSDEGKAEELVLDEVLEKKKASSDPVAREIAEIKRDEILSPFAKNEIMDAKSDKAETTSKPEMQIPVTKDPFISGPPRQQKKKPAGAKVAGGNSFYTVQIAAFARENDANKLKKQLQQKGIKARVDRGSRFYFVRSGKSKSRNSLKSRLDKIKADSKLKPILVKKQIG